MEFNEDDIPQWDPTDRPGDEDYWENGPSFLFDPGVCCYGTQGNEMSDCEQAPNPEQTMRDLLRQETDADPADLCRQLADLADTTESLDPTTAEKARIHALAIALNHEDVVDPGLAIGLLGQFEASIDTSIASDGTAAQYKYAEAQRTVDIFSTLIERAPTIDAAEGIEQRALQFFVSPPMERAYRHWIAGLSPAMEFRRNVEVIGFTPNIEQVRQGDCHTHCLGVFFGANEQDAMLSAIEDYCVRDPDDKETFDQVRGDPDSINTLSSYNGGAVGAELSNRLRLWMDSDQRQTGDEFYYLWDDPYLLPDDSKLCRARFKVVRNDCGYQFEVADTASGSAMTDFAHEARRPVAYKGDTEIKLTFAPEMRNADTRGGLDYRGEPCYIPVATADLPIFRCLEEIGRALGHDTLAQHARMAMTDPSVAQDVLDRFVARTDHPTLTDRYYRFSYTTAREIQDDDRTPSQNISFPTLNAEPVVFRICSIDDPQISNYHPAEDSSVTVVNEIVGVDRPRPYNPEDFSIDVYLGDSNTGSVQAAEFATRAKAYVYAVEYLVRRRRPRP